MGFTLPVDKPSLVEYKLQKRYNKWEFNYDPMEDQMMAASSLFGGSSVDGSSTGTSTGNMPNGFGNSNSGFGNSNSGFGNSNSGFGNSGFGNGNNGLGGSNGGSGLGGSNPNGSSGSGGTNPPGGSSNPQ